MPTGYTANIGDKDITFKQFVWSCARNFGALVMMRDDPIDAEIPEEFKPSNYHKESLEKAYRELKDLDQISEKEATLKAIEECNEKNKQEKEHEKKKLVLKNKYLAMLEKVKAWNPPSPDHENLKKFMISQIEQSIDFDCKIYPSEINSPLSGKKWLEGKRKELLWEIEYHTKEDHEECERVAGRNLWLKQLRESLKGEP